MANEKNLIPFTTENQPPGASKSRKGIPNRATALEKWLKVKVKVSNKAVDRDGNETGEKVFESIKAEEIKITLEESVALALIQKAQTGDVLAIREIGDVVWGKITEKTELSAAVEVRQTSDLSRLSTDELIAFKQLLEKTNGE